MAKQTDQTEKSNSMKNAEIPEMNVGVVGHIDHGKTTLLSRLTGKFTDTHSEELKRGITIKLGYAETTVYKDGNNYNNEKKGEPVRYISFVDAPGHEMLMATMLSGAAVIDSAILVVAANEGIKPQTKEHFMALQAKGVKNIIVAQNKIDLVDKQRALESYQEIKALLKGTLAENAPIIPISAQQGININRILKELCEQKIPERDSKSDPVFIIARSFDINRPGTNIKDLHGGILGGILKKGTLRTGDEIEIKPGMLIKKANQKYYQTLTTRILSLHKGKDTIQEAIPGPSISIETTLDPFLTKADSLTGCVVSKKGVLPEISYKIKIRYTLLNEISGSVENEQVEQIKIKDMLMLSSDTTITIGTVERIVKNEIELSLNIPIIALLGNHVGIARNVKGHWRLIGWGEFVA